ncbi:MAG: transposase [Fidelibacterota bacterium]
MKFQNKYKIESIRLKYWDYSNPGMYFVTICTKKFYHWFGNVIDGEMVLNNLGKIAEECWNEITDHFGNVELDEFVIMPNHVHGIITILDVETRRAVSLLEHINKFGPLKKGSLPIIVGSYKSAVTRLIRKHNTPNFAWQRRFYDHVNRNEDSLEKIQIYIRTNPEIWNKDRDIINEDRLFIKKILNKEISLKD